MPRIATRLTDKAVMNAKPDTKSRKLFDGEGLFLLVKPDGSKYWRLKFRYGGKEKLLALGVYPKLTLAAARVEAGKARKPAVRKWLMEAPSPSLLAMAAHGLYVWDIASDWSKIKFDRMKRILVAKFTQHDDLKALLLGTGHARLVESATVDNAVNRLWGEVNGVGQNKLGVLLMEVRAELLAAQAEPLSKGKARASSISPKTVAARPPKLRRRAAVEAVNA